MSGVVLRCPNCGTTKAAPGECEACHEAQVRYFCTNHAPGQWLDAPACPECGARFGEAARPAPARTPAPAPAPAPAPRPAATSWLDKAAGGPWGGRKGSPAPAAPGGRGKVMAARDALRARLPDLVSRATSRVRRRPEPVEPDVEAPAARPAPGGCVARALFIAVFLLMAFLAMSVLLGGSLLQIFGGYSY